MIYGETNRINSIIDSIGKGSNFEIKNQKNSLERVVEILPKTIHNAIEKQKNSLQQVEQSIKLMDPIQVLKRGYSISLIDGKSINKNTKIEKGTVILTKTFYNEIESEVTKIDTRF